MITSSPPPAPDCETWSSGPAAACRGIGVNSVGGGLAGKPTGLRTAVKGPPPELTAPSRLLGPELGLNL